VTRGRRTDAVANHARILEAARAVLAERGLDLEVSEVAERAGVGVGTLYRHFANRDDLVRAVLVQTLEDVLARVRATAEIEDAAMALRQIPFVGTTEQPVFAAMQDPRAARLTQDMKQQMHKPKSDDIVDVIAGIVARGMQCGAFRANLDPRVTALAIIGSMATVYESMSPTRSLSELAGLLADLHGGMVGARGAAHTAAQGQDTTAQG
jgi:AcrR family transcriptional regulator